MELINLLYETGIKCPKDMERTEISGVVTDSRNAKKGCLFVCLEGNHTDGHIYAAEAVLKGASALVCDPHKEVVVQNLSDTIPILSAKDCRAALSRLSANFYRHPAKEMTMFGVTGTNGKTTVTHMVRGIQQTAGNPCGLIGTISYVYGDEKLEADRTTPDSCFMQGLLRSMADSGVLHCAMEVSSHGLCLNRVDDIPFSYGAFTNLTVDHLDFHGGMEQYYQAKKRLFSLVTKGAIINVDDGYGSRLYEELLEEKKQGLRSFELWSCSLKNPDAAVYMRPVAYTTSGCSAQVFCRGKQVGDLHLAMAGQFALYNALVAAAMNMAEGVSFDQIKRGLEEMEGVAGRFQLVKNEKGIVAIVDYCHTPDALENALKTARSLDKGKLICVFGCGGDRDKTKRPLMGTIAGRYSDYCIVTSDNPRTEDQKVIASEILSGLKNTGCPYQTIEKRRDAIQLAIDMYTPGDIILIAGKGHESYQIIGSSKTYFSDYETVKSLIL